MHNYRVLVTGANRGLGYHIAERFEKEGLYVLRHLGANDTNLNSLSDTNRLIDRAKRAAINLIVNNAAIKCPGKLISEYAAEDIASMINVNLVAPIMLVNGLADSLKMVININSMVGLEAKPRRTVYAAAKWGLRGFSHSLSSENPGLQVLDVYPTNIKTSATRVDAMDIDYVVSAIFEAIKMKKRILVLDGRKK